MNQEQKNKAPLGLMAASTGNLDLVYELHDRGLITPEDLNVAVKDVRIQSSLKIKMEPHFDLGMVLMANVAQLSGVENNRSKMIEDSLVPMMKQWEQKGWLKDVEAQKKAWKLNESWYNSVGDSGLLAFWKASAMWTQPWLESAKITDPLFQGVYGSKESYLRYCKDKTMNWSPRCLNRKMNPEQWSAQADYELNTMEWAIFNGLTDWVDELMKMGLKINSENSLGRKAWSFVQNAKMLGWMLDHGLDILEKDRYGLSVVNYINSVTEVQEKNKMIGLISDHLKKKKSADNEDSMEVLRDINREGMWESLLKAAKPTAIKLVQSLKYDVQNERSERGFSMLQETILHEKVSTTEWLLSKGAKVQEVNERGMTFLGAWMAAPNASRGTSKYEMLMRNEELMRAVSNYCSDLMKPNATCNLLSKSGKEVKVHPLLELICWKLEHAGTLDWGSQNLTYFSQLVRKMPELKEWEKNADASIIKKCFEKLEKIQRWNGYSPSRGTSSIYWYNAVADWGEHRSLMVLFERLETFKGLSDAKKIQNGLSAWEEIWKEEERYWPEKKGSKEEFLESIEAGWNGVLDLWKQWIDNKEANDYDLPYNARIFLTRGPAKDWDETMQLKMGKLLKEKLTDSMRNFWKETKPNVYVEWESLEIKSELKSELDKKNSRDSEDTKNQERTTRRL